MDRFWQWLMQANARGVFVATVAALCLVTGWWLRQEINPAEDGIGVGGNGGTRLAKARVHLGVLDYVEEQLAVDATLVPETPFRPASRRRVYRHFDRATSLLPPPPSPPMPPRPPDETTLTAPPSRLFPPSVPRAGTPAGPVAVTLVYRGLFKRADGHTLALIEDSESKRRMFRDVGATVDGFGTRIESVAAHGVTLITTDDEAVQLLLGEPASFVEGHHVKEPDNAIDPGETIL